MDARTCPMRQALTDDGVLLACDWSVRGKSASRTFGGPNPPLKLDGHFGRTGSADVPTPEEWDIPLRRPSLNGVVKLSH